MQDRDLEGCRAFEIAAGRSPTLRIVNASGELEVTKSKRRVVVRQDGRALSGERVVYEGRVIRVVSEEGEPVLMVGAFPGGPGPSGQLVYSPDLDPGSRKARFGFDTRALEDDDAAHLGIEPELAFRVTDVCPGSPASRSDLRKDDVILGESVDGDLLTLSVLRAGRRLSVTLQARQGLRWPGASEVEAYLQRAFGERAGG